MRDLSDVSLKPRDFAALAEPCKRGRDFPRNIAGWNELLTQATKDARGRNLYPSPLLLDVRAFAAWCDRLKIVPCLDALRAFVIIKRREVP